MVFALGLIGGADPFLHDIAGFCLGFWAGAVLASFACRDYSEGTDGGLCLREDINPMDGLSGSREENSDGK
jgi:hypothetical protein